MGKVEEGKGHRQGMKRGGGRKERKCELEGT